MELNTKFLHFPVLCYTSMGHLKNTHDDFIGKSPKCEFSLLRQIMFSANGTIVELCPPKKILKS